MGEQDVVAGGQRLAPVGVARGMLAVEVAEHGDDPWLVVGDPVLDPVPQAL